MMLLLAGPLPSLLAWGVGGEGVANASVNQSIDRIAGWRATVLACALDDCVYRRRRRRRSLAVCTKDEGLACRPAQACLANDAVGYI